MRKDRQIFHSLIDSLLGHPGCTGLKLGPSIGAAVPRSWSRELDGSGAPIWDVGTADRDLVCCATAAAISFINSFERDWFIFTIGFGNHSKELLFFPCKFKNVKFFFYMGYLRVYCVNLISMIPVVLLEGYVTTDALVPPQLVWPPKWLLNVWGWVQ